MNANTLHLMVPMPPMGKARPRLSRGCVHMPKNYVKWKRDFSTCAVMQSFGISFDGPFSISVCIKTKTGSMRSDLDNALGSILDALQDVAIIKNDRHCRSISVHIEKWPENIINVTLSSR